MTEQVRNMDNTGKAAEPIVQMKDVCKWYGQFSALYNINLDVYPGEKVVVCGPSGSGKSTMIRCINRLEAHHTGTIRVAGKELTADTKNIEQIRRDVGMVFQQFNLFPHMTVLDNLTIGPIRNLGVSKSEARALAMEYLERVHIAE